MIPMFCFYYTVIFLTAPFRKVAECLGKFHNMNVGASNARPYSAAARVTLLLSLFVP